MNAVGETTEFGHPMRSHFLFDTKWRNLNHGSYGAHPLPVRNALRGYQKLADSAPDRFMKYQYVDLLDKARERVARLINAHVEDTVFIPNATTGVNTVLRNILWEEKDAIIYFDTAYASVEKTLLSLIETNPQIHLRKVGHGQEFAYQLPCTHSEILNAFSQTISRLLYEGYTPRAAVFDTIVSIPGVRFPFERLVKLCKEYGIYSVVDGAHGVGQIPLDMRQLDPDFFTSNCHKWLYTPRACAVFYVPLRNQHLIRTSFPTSHGFRPLSEWADTYTGVPPATKSGFVNLFERGATMDQSPYYCIPAAMNFREKLCGGEDRIYDYIRDIAQRGADLLASILGTEVMDDLDSGEGLKAIGSYEGSDRRDGGGFDKGGLRDCAMANVMLPFKIAGAQKQGSLSLGPGGAGSGGGLLAGLNSGRKFSAGYSSPQPSPGFPPANSPWSEAFRTSSPSSIGFEESGPVTIRKPDVPKHIDWMLRTMVNEYHTNVQIFAYDGKVWTRISGQIYLELKDFEWLGGVLKGLCERVRMGESLWQGGAAGLTLRAPSTSDLERLGSNFGEVSISPGTG